MIEYIIISVCTEDEKTDLTLLENFITVLQICTQKPVTFTEKDGKYIAKLTSINQVRELLLNYSHHETINNEKEKQNCAYLRDLLYKTIEKQDKFKWMRITLHEYSL